MNTVEQILASEATRRGLHDLRFEPIGHLVRLLMPGMSLGIYPARELARRLGQLPAEVTGRPSLTTVTAGMHPLCEGWMALPGRGSLRFEQGRPVELNLSGKTPEQVQLRAEEMLGAWIQVDAWRGQRVDCRIVDRPGGYRVTYLPKGGPTERTEIVYLEGHFGWALPESRNALASSPHRVLWQVQTDGDVLDASHWRVVPSVLKSQDVRHGGYTCRGRPRNLRVERIAPFAVMPAVRPLTSALPRGKTAIASPTTGCS